MTTGQYGRRWFLHGMLSVLGLLGLAAADGARPEGPPALDVRDFGATGDGSTRDTAAIQAAVDAAFATGGGTVLLPTGRFLSGTITVRCRVTLHLAPGAVLLGSPDIADYPAHDFTARDLDIGGHSIWALLYADGAEQIAIEGEGVIDGQGEHFKKVPVRNPEVPSGPRPRMIFFKNCRTVTLRNLTLREAGMWTVHLALCDDVQVSGLHVASSFNLHQDGIVLDSCRGATVRDCHVDTEDDAIVLKSSFPRPCSDITITDCEMQSRCAGLKLGTQSLGGFRAIVVADCVLHDCRLGGVKIQTVDGGDLEDITVQNITMHDVAAPISLRRGNRGFDYGFTELQRPRPVGRLHHVLIRRVRAATSTDPTLLDAQTMSIAGIPGHPVDDVTLEDIDITLAGGGTSTDAGRVSIPELEAAYPEHTMFGVLPAYGLWARHAAGLTLRNVRLRVVRADARPALVCDDVDGLGLTDFDAGVSGAEPLVRLHDVRGASVHACQPAGSVDTFVRVEGERSADIDVSGNDLDTVRLPVDKGYGVIGNVIAANNPGSTGP